jgi:hypothetical protein
MVPINLIAKPKEVKYGHFSKIHSGIPTVRARQTQWGLSSTCSSKNSCSVRDIFKQALAPKQLYADRLNFAPEEIPLSRPVKAGQEKKDASQSNYVPALKELRLIREWSIIPKSVLRKFVPTFRAPNDSRARAGCDGKNLFATSCFRTSFPIMLALRTRVNIPRQSRISVNLIITDPNISRVNHFDD